MDRSPKNTPKKFFDSVCVCACSVMSDSATPWTVAYRAPLSMEFSTQEYYSGLPFPPPGDLPDLGSNPVLFGTGQNELPSTGRTIY